MTMRGFPELAMPIGARLLTAPVSAETLAHLDFGTVGLQ